MEFRYCGIVKMKCNEIADFRCHDFMEFTMAQQEHIKFSISKQKKKMIFSVTFSPEQ